MSAEDFRHFLRIFATTHDPKAHEEALLAMLDPLDLDVEYQAMKQDGGLRKVLEVFEGFAEVPADEYIGEFERSSLTHVGQLTKEYFSRREYHAFAQMVFVLTLESLLEHYSLLEGIEITDKHVADLYTQIAEDIYVQTFLLEHMSHPEFFAWQRDREIIEQSLVAMTVCFSDIYGYLSEQEESDDYAD